MKLIGKYDKPSKGYEMDQSGVMYFNGVKLGGIGYIMESEPFGSGALKAWHNWLYA